VSVPTLTVDLTNKWDRIIIAAEFVIFEQRWEARRLDQNQSADVWRPVSPLACTPLTDILIGIAFLATPQGKFLCFHHLFSLVLAQIGNLFDSAIPKLTKPERVDLPVPKKSRRDPLAIRDALKLGSSSVQKLNATLLIVKVGNL
jgi:hypothetical protein